MFSLLVSVASAWTVPLPSTPAVTSPYIQYAPPAGALALKMDVPAPLPTMAQPVESDQTSTLVALCGLGALLGFGAARYNAAFAVSGKRALPAKHARTAAPIMQIAPGQVAAATGVGASRAGPGMDSSIL